ncbi:MAG: hypothetical protein DRI24_19865 [Deltaproteobacteria bacterium]|nr:MAG: hypothetical protein DRI24_19865 [Deltaproteobacteria bacterium]
MTYTLTKVEGDQFDKSKGRKIAVGRLTKSPFVINPSKGTGNEHPMDIIRSSIGDMNVPPFVVRSVTYHHHRPPGANVSMSKLIKIIEAASGDISEANEESLPQEATAVDI